MNCLNCNAEMTNNVIRTLMTHISYDICEACGSFWLDAGEFKKLAFQVTGDIEYCSKDEANGISESSKKCPRCEEIILNKVFFLGYSEIVLDRCENCGGFWLDGGELDLINKELEKIMHIKGHGFSHFINKAHLPYWYKRIRRKSSEVDFKVDVPPIKGAKLQIKTTNICPACDNNLSLYTIFGIEIDGCSRCKGIWLDKDELRKLKDKIDTDSWRTLRWLDDEIESIEKVNSTISKRVCPKCKDVKLLSSNFGDSTTIIDWCPNCHGNWLDKEEFQEIVLHLREELDKLSSSEMKKKLYEEIEEIWDGHEGTMSEIMDAKAAISALINITIFEHPVLFKILTGFSNSARLP